MEYKLNFSQRNFNLLVDTWQKDKDLALHYGPPQVSVYHTHCTH